MWNANWHDFVALTYPGYLAWLALLPLIVVLSMRSLAGLGRVRRPLTLGLRCLVIAAMVLAMAGPEWVRTTGDQTVVFALDHSASVPANARREAAQFLQASTTTMRPGHDGVGVLGFDGHAAVEQVPQPKLLAARLGDPIDPQHTNIAEAMRLGLALLPADTAKRLVLVSDGNENAGSAADEADAYAALGIPVDVVPLHYEHNGEMLVDTFTAPTHAKRDETINLQLVVRSQVATHARLLLYHNDRLVDLNPSGASAALPIQLAAGPNRFSLPMPLHASGVHRFRAEIQPVDPTTDAIANNNEGGAFTIVGAAERVLLVSDTAADPGGGNAASARLLSDALAAGGVQCQQISVDDLPSDPAALSDCSTVILANVSAFALGEAREHLLASYVRDQGGGLIVIGGDQAFSVGGYAHTPLEEILPVETSRDKLKLLSLAMVIVIDRSGSMQGEKIAMARQAALASVQLLRPLDQIGVIAFNSASEWVVPLQRANNKPAIVSALGTIGADGGTDAFPALAQAQTALIGANASLRHIILLTDGRSTPADFDALARVCKGEGITISTIAVGPDADRALLTRIAQLSGGRMYIADSAQPLPQIFARETVLASHSGVYERQFTPQLRAAPDEQIVRGLTQADIPPLHGQVVTSAKPLARVPLVRKTEDGTDPILAYWQVGLGRTVAFTSGLWPRWGPQWVSWSGFSKFWTQAVRYAGRAGQWSDLEVATTVKNGQAHVVVSAEHLPPRLQRTLSLTGQAVVPDFSTRPLQLQRTGIDRFEATFPVAMLGTYLVNVAYDYGAGQHAASGVLRTGIVQNYSPEYRALCDNEAVLADVARRTGGRVLSPRQPDAVFEASSIRPVQVRRPFWEDLVRLMLLLFLLDVAVRRIAVTPAEAVTNVRAFFCELAGRPPADRSAATLATLRSAKDRVREENAPAASSSAWSRQTDSAPGSSGAALREAQAARRRQQELDALTRALGGADADKPAVSAPPPRRRGPASSEGDYTARLLRAKRRARGDDEDEPA